MICHTSFFATFTQEPCHFSPPAPGGPSHTSADESRGQSACWRGNSNWMRGWHLDAASPSLTQAGWHWHGRRHSDGLPAVRLGQQPQRREQAEHCCQPGSFLSPSLLQMTMCLAWPAAACLRARTETSPSKTAFCEDSESPLHPLAKAWLGSPPWQPAPRTRWFTQQQSACRKAVMLRSINLPRYSQYLSNSRTFP